MLKKDILSCKLDELEVALTEMGEKKFRAKQIYEWLHIRRAANFDEMSNISLSLRTKLSENFYINRINIVKKLESSIDNTVKYLYELSDGNHVEAVLMEYKHGNSLCISTQVGCKMGCKFCASTIAGFKRHLLASEMLLQIYEAEKESGRHVDSLVLMGIGEPLDNFDNVIRFLQIISFETGKNLSLRHVSLSTCGLVNRIYDLAEYRFGLTLSISLHAVTDEKRSEIMPVNNKFCIAELLEACRDYIDKTGRRISFEYSVIHNVNDSPEDAAGLIRLLKGMNCHVNLIPVNEIKERDFKSDRRALAAFAEMLEKGGLNVTTRRTLGADINAACGQLRREYEI
ncbi:MAG: 23S rRNA (adenine(2503)-C(2))-methyltransferase RlmN [Oscillospiraceae bacterium]|nr:23S rRNA (adenine(2503)-C(2))-methyltransferase RlmN [Oscillospiraceae bacterium]